MTNIRSLDMLLLDDIFEMGGGYVLAFSDRTFGQFFAEELGIDINDPKFSQNGTSKAKRLRYFLQSVDKQTAIRTLNALWEYREALRRRNNQPERHPDASENLRAIIGRLAGEPPTTAQIETPEKCDAAQFQRLQSDLLSLSALEPQARGYAFEKFLKQLFDAFGLEAREAFRVVGEQIDGSFLLGNETYLLEAKWQGPPCGNADLHAFHGKIEQKAAWTRGLFISFSGFTEDGLTAFGRGKRVVCMDGYDLSEALTRQLSMSQVLEKKVRRAGETGMAFVRVRELFSV